MKYLMLSLVVAIGTTSASEKEQRLFSSGESYLFKSCGDVEAMAKSSINFDGRYNLRTNLLGTDYIPGLPEGRSGNTRGKYIEEVIKEIDSKKEKVST